MATSFQTDIAPMLAPFRANMMWRFDITDYDTVSKNAERIAGQILATPGNAPSMPPAPFPPLTAAQQSLYIQWMNDGCPP